MAPPIHILLASPKTPPRGGIGTWTELVLGEASRRQDVVIHHVDIAPRWRKVSSRGTAWRVVGGTLQGIRDCVRVMQVLRTKPVNAMHITTSGHFAALRDCVMLALARRHRIPAVLHIHFGRLPTVIERAGWEWKLTRLALRSATAVVVMDRASQAALTVALPSLRVRTIANGVSLDDLPPDHFAPRGMPEILYLGWILESKGLNELVEAWSGITSIPSRLVVIGPGDTKLSDQLRGFASARGAGPRFELTDEITREQAIERMRHTDICVLPSHSEGCPYVILEAMACGKAILATSVGAIPEMLDRDGPVPCGVLVPPRVVERLQAALESLLGDACRRQVLGRRARARAELKYGLPQVFSELYILWDSVIEQAARGVTAAGRASKPTIVLLVSPKPPPRGGIGTWTETVLAEAAQWPDLEIHHVDIAPRWRFIHQQGFLRRLAGGAIQGIRDTVRVLRVMRTLRGQAVSITSTGSLAVLRDNVILSMARRYRMRSHLHMRIGCIPEIIYQDGWEWALLRRAMRKASSVIVLDHASESALACAMPEVRIERIPNCITLSALTPVVEPASRDMPEILYLGWVLPSKGIRELVEAWSKITSIASRLVLIGPGAATFSDELQRLAATRGASARLELAGEVARDQAIERMRQTDICVLASYSEGFPYAVSEAMACGKAIVATKVGAIPEMLDQDGAAPCGLLVPPREIEPLRTALESLLRDAGRRQVLGRLARARVEAEYATPVVFDRLIRLWRGM